MLDTLQVGGGGRPHFGRIELQGVLRGLVDAIEDAAYQFDDGGTARQHGTESELGGKLGRRTQALAQPKSLTFQTHGR